MTERLGRRARWTAALLAAPGAAALFGTATSWALHAAPDTSTSPPPEQHTRQAADPAVLGAQHSAAANRQQLQKLEKQLARLRTQVAALGTSTPRAGATPPGGASASGTTGPAAGTSSAPPPPAPPPVQTSTGASGAPK